MSTVIPFPREISSPRVVELREARVPRIPAQRTAQRVRSGDVAVSRVAPRSGAVRLTRRGRVAAVLGFLVVALALMVVFGGLATATHDAGTPPSVRVVTVQPGDTLYDIAGRVAPAGEVRSMMLRIQELNSLSGSSLQVGQQIAVPRD